MKKPLLLGAIASALLLVMPHPAFAGGSKKTKATAPPAPAEPVIANVTQDAVTVSDEKGSRTYVVTQFTEITLNGQRATLAELKPGMKAKVVLGTDALRASRITASSVAGHKAPKK
jgi:hypothetical protein